MKKSLAIFATVLAAVLNAATPSTSLVYKNTTTNALTGNIVVGNNTTISATGNGTITATALTGNITGNPTVSGNLTVSGDVLLSTNNAYIKGKTSGNSTVSLMALTTDNLTRFIAGVDASGFQWTNQGQTAAWASLNSSALSVTGNLTVSGGGTNVLNGPSAAITTSGSGVNGTLCLTESPTSGAMLMMGTNGGNHAYVQMTNSSNLAAAYPIALNPNGGNVLIGTLTDVGAKVYSKVADGTISFGAAGTTKGIRFAHASTYSTIDGVDSSLSGSYQPLQINGSTVQIATNGGTVAASFSSAQALRLHGYGAGTLTTDSSGNVTATSDERAKNITGTFTKGLAEVVKLTPKRYTWKQETGLNTTDEVASLTAQDLIAAGIPEAVSTYRTVTDLNDDGTPKLDADGKPLTKRIDAIYTVSDRAVIAALVNAVKELNAKVAALEAARK